MNYRTYADMALHIKQILPKISDADLIVGIPRSGMVPAYMIGAFLNRYVCSLDEFVSGIVYSKGMRSVRERTVKKVLVVDDSVNDGLAMRRAKERLQGKEKEFELVYMAVYAVEKAISLVDVYADICPQPRFFQWNYMYHPGLLPQACLDIDGVLCVDPTAEENDDGEKYRQFILNARPLFVPNDKVKALELLGKHLGVFDSGNGPGNEQENNIFEVIDQSTREEIDTDEIPEIEPPAKSGHDLVE